MNNQLLEEVKAFVADFWSEPEENLSTNTSLNVDLGMDGDDALDFMLLFSDFFRVDLTNFPYDKHFGPEGGANPFSIIEALVRCVTTGKWTDLAPLTLRDFAEAAENGVWRVDKDD